MAKQKLLWIWFGSWRNEKSSHFGATLYDRAEQAHGIVHLRIPEELLQDSDLRAHYLALQQLAAVERAEIQIAEGARRLLEEHNVV